MMIRKRILALLFTAICLFGILPLSVGAITPAIEGATYTLISPNLITTTPPDYTTPVLGKLNYFYCEGSADGLFQTVNIDVFSSSEINEIGYVNTVDIKAVVFKTSLDGLLYVPEIEAIPLPFEDVPFTLIFTEQAGRLIMILSAGEEQIMTYVKSEVSFILTNILDTTDMSTLNGTLEAFSTELTTDNYVDWMLDSYNRIVDVFVNNAKIQYVMDNPIFIIALVVFAMAIAFAIATFIFKIFRRY